MPLDAEAAALGWERFLTRIGGRDVDPAEEAAAMAWSDGARRPTWAMWRCLFEGAAPPPAWALVRALEVMHDEIDDALLARWLDAGHLAGITELRLGGRGLTAASVARVCEQVPGLRRLDVRRLRPPAAGAGRPRWASRPG
jgi:hypothetical protein